VPPVPGRPVGIGAVVVGAVVGAVGVVLVGVVLVGAGRGRRRLVGAGRGRRRLVGAVVVAVGAVVVAVGAVVVAVGAVVVAVGAVVVVVVVVVAVGAVVEAVQADGTSMVSSTRVTAPFLASSRPVTEAVEAIEIEVKAKTLPLNVPPPSAAELPTCQNTQPACAPFSSATVLVVEVVRPEPTWKMYTPFPFKVTVPVRFIVEVALYTPGTKVRPVMSE